MDFASFLALNRGVITALGIVGILVLLGLSAFFSSSETALFSIAPHRVEEIVREESGNAGQTVQQLKEDPHRLLETILVGNNLVNIAMASLATGLFGLYVSSGMAIIGATVAITVSVILFGEIAARSYAVGRTEWPMHVAKPLKFVESILFPLVVIFDFLARQINRVTGGRIDIEIAYDNRQEIADIIETGEREGILDRDEREILERTLRFNETIAKEAMTPRLDMTAIPTTDSVEEAIQTCIQSGHARMPVYDGEIDNVIGVVHIRDLVRDLNYGESDTLELDDVIHPVLHVPESKNVDKLLGEMRENRMHMVIVIDEFGTTEGLITIEDIVEEIVGEILDGSEKEPIEFVDTDTVLVRGEVNIDDVNEALDTQLPEGEEFETIAGFIFNRAGRLVEPGEEITYDGITIHVEQVDNTRILKARIIRNTEAENKNENENEKART